MTQAWRAIYFSINFIDTCADAVIVWLTWLESFHPNDANPEVTTAAEDILTNFLELYDKVPRLWSCVKAKGFDLYRITLLLIRRELRCVSCHSSCTH